MVQVAPEPSTVEMLRDLVLRTLRKSGTNSSGICVNLTNTYTLWVKGP